MSTHVFNYFLQYTWELGILKMFLNKLVIVCEKPSGEIQSRRMVLTNLQQNP